MLQRYLAFVKIVSQQFKDIASVVDITIERLRLKLKDGSLIDIKFPVPEKFSFHWMHGAKLFRVDTAPHHPNVRTAPRHVHYEREDDIREDFITGNIDDPVERFKSFLNWVRKTM